MGARGSAGTNVGSTQASLRSIQDLIKESETTTSTNDMNTYSDPIDEASNDTPPPSSPPPSSPPPSSPPSSGMVDMEEDTNVTCRTNRRNRST